MTAPGLDIRLEKIVPALRQRRYYHLSLVQTLFGEWCLTRTWGRIGAAGGQSKTEYSESQEAALASLSKLKSTKCRRGYAVIPVQLELFD
ncbi:WGR domain-containing protein [Shimia aestuarii]|uniref:WGR domain-containing protein, predicted DNA-binding domain in MolR n=1 Tax=Shimia aestuarii TaxID=254406 RepID=A0A1I4T7T2_9RHOB|nr:WGR domain-containing protein [Shimia aestuarii]SFM72627.1 WGR domain-containing protein, predicted DNA-binding domain in MolR [Shimia aestuarii]